MLSLSCSTVPTLEFPSTVDEDIGSVEVCILGGAAAVPVVLSTADYCGYVDRASACGRFSLRLM